MKVSKEETIEQSVDIIKLIEELQEKHGDVFWTTISNDIYIYKPLGRKDYKEIMSGKYDELEIEDQVCLRCLFYPDAEELIENGYAGIPHILFEKIIVESRLDSIETRKAVRKYFIEQMEDSDNQTNCIIHEAFPEFPIEEIENWGIEKTSKYLAMAEWMLSQFRGVKLSYELLEKQDQDEVKKDNKKERMSPEKLAEIKKMYPEIDLKNKEKVSIQNDPNNINFDTTPPALRPGFFR